MKKKGVRVLGKLFNISFRGQNSPNIAEKKIINIGKIYATLLGSGEGENRHEYKGGSKSNNDTDNVLLRNLKLEKNNKIESGNIVEVGTRLKLLGVRRLWGGETTADSHIINPTRFGNFSRNLDVVGKTLRYQGLVEVLRNTAKNKTKKNTSSFDVDIRIKNLKKKISEASVFKKKYI